MAEDRLLVDGIFATIVPLSDPILTPSLPRCFTSRTATLSSIVNCFKRQSASTQCLQHSPTSAPPRSTVEHTTSITGNRKSKSCIRHLSTQRKKSRKHWLPTTITHQQKSQQRSTLPWKRSNETTLLCSPRKPWRMNTYSRMAAMRRAVASRHASCTSSLVRIRCSSRRPCR